MTALFDIPSILGILGAALVIVCVLFGFLFFVLVIGDVIDRRHRRPFK